MFTICILPEYELIGEKRVMKRKRFRTFITSEDVLDVTLHWDKKTIYKFALNYRAIIRGVWKEIYRVDNYHGFLHQQKFWRTSRPLPIEHEEGLPLDMVVKKYTDHIFENFERYKRYFRISIRKQDDENEKENTKE